MGLVAQARARKGAVWALQIIAALREQTVVVTSTNAAAMVIPTSPHS